MSNIASAEASSATRTYTFQTNVNGTSRKFNFSPNDTIQSMIDTMGKTSLQSSGSCQSISEDAVYSEGMLFESNPSSLLPKSAPMSMPTTDGLFQFIDAVNGGELLTEDTMKSYLHPSIRIQEPGGVHSGLCACVAFLKEIFEVHGRPELQLQLDPVGLTDTRSGTLMVDVSFTPVTVEIPIMYSCVLGLVSQWEFQKNPRQITGFNSQNDGFNLRSQTQSFDSKASLEDTWTFDAEDLGIIVDDQVVEATMAACEPSASATALPEPAWIPPPTTAAVDSVMSSWEDRGHNNTNAVQDLLYNPCIPAPAVAEQVPAPKPAIKTEISALPQLDELIFGELGSFVQENWLDNIPEVPAVVQARPAPQKKAPAAAKPKAIVVSDAPVVHREGYMRSKAHEARGVEQDYACGYCGHARTSASACSDGRVRIRCACGGKHRDGKPRMHANWKPVTGKVVKKEEDSDAASANTTGTTSDLVQVTSQMSLGACGDTGSLPKYVHA